MKARLGKNIIAGFLSQIITVICGFILPRYMLKAYGSTVNGVVSSISQFLGVISFMQMGVGAVVQTSFYEPLARNNFEDISKIYASANRFFRTIAIIFSVYVVALFVFYPNFIATQYDFWFTGALIIIMAISVFAQYYFGLTNQLLLTADQKAYIPLAVDAATLVLSTIVSVVLIRFGASVQVVKLLSAAIFILRPAAFTICVKRHYAIQKKIRYVGEPIKQKWNGFAQHLASTVMDNTDVIVLTVFSTLDNVSIYYVYHMVVFGIRQLVVSTTSGLQSYFGRLLVDAPLKEQRSVFEKTEWIYHICVTGIFSCVLTLIVPFVRVYTKGITDVNYILPAFGVVLSLAQAAYCYRIVYFTIIKAAGHYKQTQRSAIIEMILNLSTSIICVSRFGLLGVAVGTLFATAYRLIYFVVYLKNHILQIRLLKTVYYFALDAVSIGLSYLAVRAIPLRQVSYGAWVVLAVQVGVISFGISIAVGAIGNAKLSGQLLRKLGDRKAK